MERQLSRYKDQVASLQTNHDTSQATMLSHSMRFGTSNNHARCQPPAPTAERGQNVNGLGDTVTDEAVSAKLAEMEIVMSDLERANERIASLERDKVRCGPMHCAHAHHFFGNSCFGDNAGFAKQEAYERQLQGGRTTDYGQQYALPPPPYTPARAKNVVFGANWVGWRRFGSSTSDSWR